MTSPAPPPGKIFTLHTLQEKGIPWSANHIRRLVAAGRFPPPIFLSERRPGWTEKALDEWLTQRQAKREAERANFARKRLAEGEAKKRQRALAEHHANAKGDAP